MKSPYYYLILNLPMIENIRNIFYTQVDLNLNPNPNGLNPSVFPN